MARFGSRRSDHAVVLKQCTSKHTGNMRPKLAKDGRKWKMRRDKWLQKSVAIVSKVKAGLPTPRDIMKAANNTQGISPHTIKLSELLSRKER